MATETSIPGWVRAQFQQRYCDEAGKQKDIMNPKKLAKALKKERPKDGKAVEDAVESLDAELYARRIPKKEYAIMKATVSEVAAIAEVEDDGSFVHVPTVAASVAQKHPEIHMRKITDEVEQLQKANVKLRKTAAAKNGESCKDVEHAHLEANDLEKSEKSEKSKKAKKKVATPKQETLDWAEDEPTESSLIPNEPPEVSGKSKNATKKAASPKTELVFHDGANDEAQAKMSREDVEAWMSEQYLAAFTSSGFIGWSKFKNQVTNMNSGFSKEAVKDTFEKLREPGHTWSFTHPNVVAQLQAAERKSRATGGGIQLDDSEANGHPAGSSAGRGDLKTLFPGAFAQGFTPPISHQPTVSQPAEPLRVKSAKEATPGLTEWPQQIERANEASKKAAKAKETTEPALSTTKKAAKLQQVQKPEKADIKHNNQATKPTAQATSIPSKSNGDLLSRKMQQLQVSSSNNLTDDQTDATLNEFSHMDLLLTDTTVSTTVEAAASTTSELDSEIRHAPLISEGILLKARKGTVPQYGLLGTYAPDGVEESRAKIFLNTNVPFSAFICGVQGSGKSHTTACILENALIPSPNLGRLENPVSAMIFSYGEFSSDGGGFSISEAAFLATSHPAFPGQCVKKITVLTSPSNKALGNLYRRLPNVTVIPFKLKSRSLDINTMLKLMAVNESGHTPLYLATVESILREMAAASEDGRFDYVVFKAKLKRCQFNAMQKNALDQRLALLESYLDPNDHSPEPTFEPGEVTIMDLSCPFTDANTACVMFKIGLQRYLQSKAYGKMIVLDEAHKYMLNVPGAKALTDYLLTIVRLQRHYGARVVISTQEPTVMSELIPLCSLKVIHRFSSPEWFAALRKHIPMSADDKDDTLLRIEQLKTGAALVYSSEAVLGKTDSGTLIKGTGRMLKVHVRKRVTSDGGQSIMSV